MTFSHGQVMGMVVLLVGVVLGGASSSEGEKQVREVTEEKNGIRTRTTVETDHQGGSGYVRTELVREMLADDAAKRVSDEYAVKEALSGYLTCSAVGAALPASRVLLVIAGYSCAQITADRRERLRRGDRIVSLTSSGVAGGVGASTTQREIALGSRDGRVKVLWFTYHPTDENEARKWAADVSKRVGGA